MQDDQIKNLKEAFHSLEVPQAKQRNSNGIVRTPALQQTSTEEFRPHRLRDLRYVFVESVNRNRSKQTQAHFHLNIEKLVVECKKKRSIEYLCSLNQRSLQDV